VRALDPRALAGAVEDLLRRLSEHAALHEAILEARAVRLAEPRVVAPEIVGRLGVLVRDAGLRATFAPSWSPLPEGGDCGVGILGAEGAAERLARALPADPALVGAPGPP
jgi:hypothetical protein